MTYDPDRDPYNPRRPVFSDDNSTGTAIFIGALVLLALVFGGIYFYANNDQRVASDMTINNPPATQPMNRPAPTPSTPGPSTTNPSSPSEPMRGPQPATPQQ